MIDDLPEVEVALESLPLAAPGDVVALAIASALSN